MNIEKHYNKIQGSLKSHNIELLENQLRRISEWTELAGLDFSSIKLPKKINRFTILKSPHVHKKSRDQFELVTHKATFTIKPLNKQLNAPSSIFLFLENLILNQNSSGVTLKLEREYQSIQ